MNKKKLPLGVWLKLLGGYSLFIGIIAVILLLGFILSKQNHNKKQEEKVCGGIAGIKCPTGYTCKLSSKHPDADGTCIKQEKHK